MLKSVLLGSVAVGMTVFATGAYAQATSAPVLGTGTTANEAVVIQRGNGIGLPGYPALNYGNSATVDQSGSNNKAGYISSYVDLSAGNDSTGQLAATSDGSHSVAQVGNYNTLTITQTGSNNSVLTTAGNWTKSVFGPDANGGSFQAGNFNTVNSTQNGKNGQVQFQQYGNSEKATLTVDNGAQNTYAGIFQFGGDFNKATIHQSYGANNAYAVVVQSGTANTGEIDQNGTTNYAALLQSGSFNNATINQTASGVGAFGYQTGTGNSGTITQSGAGYANAGFAQSGLYNTVSIKQH